MSDNYPRPAVPVIRASSAGLGVFQFGLTGIFVLTTAVALLLGIYFGVGRLVDMSVTDVQRFGIEPLLSRLPLILVWALGFTVAMRRFRRNRRAASLTMIAISGLFLGLLVARAEQMARFHTLWSNIPTPPRDALYPRAFAALRIGPTILEPLWWILLVAAIFFRRAPETAATQATTPQQLQDAL